MLYLTKRSSASHKMMFACFFYAFFKKKVCAFISSIFYDIYNLFIIWGVLHQRKLFTLKTFLSTALEKTLFARSAMFALTRKEKLLSSSAQVIILYVSSVLTLFKKRVMTNVPFVELILTLQV